jgi:hypothetical protein
VEGGGRKEGTKEGRAGNEGIERATYFVDLSSTETPGEGPRQLLPATTIHQLPTAYDSVLYPPLTAA